jgi:hypothetical protein
MNPHLLSEVQVYEKVRELHLDDQGPVQVVMDRLIRYLKANDLYLQEEKRKKKRSERMLQLHNPCSWILQWMIHLQT